jgi:glycosyltransferase involved in cell wall biosynthesis
MNIVTANNFLYLRGGSERVMFEEMDWLRGQGHTVNAFGRLPSDAADLPHSALMPSIVDLESVKGVGKLKAAGQIVYNRESGKRFALFCDRIKPDIAHFHNIYAGLTTAVLDVCKQHKLPSVITLHDHKLVCPTYLLLNHGKPCRKCFGGRFYHCLLTRCHKNNMAASLVTTIEAYFNHLLGKYRQADSLICPSQFLLNTLLENGIPKEKLCYIPNGVEPTRFLPVYDDSGYFLYLGRLSFEKGIKTLIESTRDNVGMMLKVVGEGPDKESLQKMTGDSVSFEGYKSGKELERLVQGAAFVVVPSECHENASMVVLEAMAYGKPVIGSRMGGIPEQVVDGETGFIFDAGDQGQLKSAIQTLVSDKAKRQEMGRAARARLVEYFSLDRHCGQLLNLYAKAMQGA